jgi:hypothetical protein
MWMFIAIFVSLASMALAEIMARNRGRSPKAWVWIAFLVGPLAPLALIFLGRAKHPTPAN